MNHSQESIRVRNHKHTTAFVLAAFLFTVACVRAFAEGPSSADKLYRCDPHKDKVLYSVGYAHLDTQWRWTYQDSINTYIPNTMHFNFKLLEKYPDYHFNFTGARRYAMMKEYYPADYEKVKEYIAKGRWFLAGSSVDENDANVPAPESVIRQVLYGNHYFKREFGKTSEDYMLPDCFGFAASLPSALAHAGLKGFSTQKLTWGSPIGIPFPVGVWDGPDGHSIPAALNPHTYSSKVRGDLSKDPYWLHRAEETGAKSGFYGDFMYYGTGDIGGSPDDESVNWVQKSVDSDGPMCVVPGSSDMIFKAMTPEDKQRLPHYKGDLLLTQHSAGSLTSQAYMKRWNRKNEMLIDSAERASVAADWLGGAPYPLDKFTKTWFLILGNQMHDILPGTSVPKAYEFSWNDEVIALNHSASTLGTAVGAIARSIDTKVKGTPLVVYNPLSIDREDIVQAKVRMPGATYVRVYDPKGKEVASQMVSKSGDAVEIAFLARVPSVGFAVFDVQKSASPCAMKTGLTASKDGLENAEYKVRLDSNGDVASVFDKIAGKELLSGPARFALLEDSPKEYPAWNIDWDDRRLPPLSYVGGPAKVRIAENGPARVALEIVRYHEGSKYTQTLRLSAGDAGDRVEFNTVLDWRTKERCLKAVFPLTASNRLASYNLGMGVVERPNNDMGKYEVPSRQWFDLTDAGGAFGAAVLEDSKFGSDKPDDNTIRLTIVRTPKCADYFDQATMDFGRHNVLYALAGHKGDWRDGNIAWRGTRLNQPMVAFTTASHSGALGKEFSFLSVDSSQVAVAALKKAEDSDEIVVRLQELLGKPAKDVAISFAAPVVSAREVDGQERSIGEATMRNGALMTNLDGFSPKSFALKIADAGHKTNPPVSVAVALAYDTDVASLDDEASGGNFDGKENAYPAELLPTEFTANGITFHFGPTAAGKNNALACKGQSIQLPKGKYNNLYLLAAATEDTKGIFKIDGKPASLGVEKWTGYVGQWDLRIWKNNMDITGLVPAFTKRDPIAWFASHLHNASGKNEAYNYSYLFLYRLPLPSNASTVTLPENPAIKIFAMTAANDANDDTAPAQNLYDNFTKPAEPPVIQPADAKYNDSVLVSINRSWYAGHDEIRYTTDGSEPTVHSALYKGPFWIQKKTVVSARAFGKDGSGSPASKSVFDIADSTPPRVASVIAYDGVPTIVVRFSEPVNAASAGRIAGYRTEPDLGIVSATLGNNNTEATFRTSSSPTVGAKYTLTASGIADTSPGANKLTDPVAVAFSITPPVFDLKFRAGDNSINFGVVPTDRTFLVQGKPAIGPGKFGSSLRLSGDRQCIFTNDSPELNPESAITVSAWVRADDWNGNRRILQKGDSDNQYRLLKEDDKLKFEIAGVGAVTSAVPTAGEWHNVAATYDGATLRLFVDGVQAGETAASGRIISTPDPLYVGAKNTRSTGTDYFKGNLDKIVIWNYALPPDRVKALTKSRRASE